MDLKGSTCGLLWSTSPCFCVRKVCNLRFAPSAAHPALSAREASFRKKKASNSNSSAMMSLVAKVLVRNALCTVWLTCAGTHAVSLSLSVSLCLSLSVSVSLSLCLSLSRFPYSLSRLMGSTCGLLWSTWPCFCVPKVCNLRFAPSAAHPALSAREASLRKQSIKFIQLCDDVVGEYCWCGIPCALFGSPVQGLMLSLSLSVSLSLCLSVSLQIDERH